jgi:hypothetical protein
VAVVGWQWCEWIDYAIASILIGDSAEFGVFWSGNMTVTI